MSEATGTAVAKRDAREAGVGSLPESVRVALELRKRAGMVAAQIANMNWGQKLDLDTRRAVAEYGRRYGIDVVTEVNVLGNNIYLNASYWLRRLSELADAGLVEYAYADHVEDDKRLSAFPDEKKRRAWERIQHGIPEAATGAVVFHVKLRSMTREVVAARWCGGGTRKNDPVGEQEPIATAETRAARRCIRLIASNKPGIFGDMDDMDRAEEQLQAVIRGGKEVWAEREAKLAPHDNVPMIPGGENPYEDTEPPMTDSIDRDERDDEAPPPVGESLFGEDVGTRPRGRKVED